MTNRRNIAVRGSSFCPQLSGCMFGEMFMANVAVLGWVPDGEPESVCHFALSLLRLGLIDEVFWRVWRSIVLPSNTMVCEALLFHVK